MKKKTFIYSLFLYAVYTIYNLILLTSGSAAASAFAAHVGTVKGDVGEPFTVAGGPIPATHPFIFCRTVNCSSKSIHEM